LSTTSPDVGRTPQDALRSIKRYMAVALGDAWEVRLAREEGTFDRPFCRVWQAAGSTYPLTGGKWLADIVTPFVVAAYPVRQETSDAALLAAQVVEDTLYRAFRVGVGDGQPLRVPLVNYTGVALDEPGVWHPRGFMRVSDLSTQPFPDPDDDKLYAVTCDVRMTWRRVAATIPVTPIVTAVPITPTILEDVTVEPEG
jgi:hypothetical protein